jgi:hypothetical protein
VTAACSAPTRTPRVRRGRPLSSCRHVRQRPGVRFLAFSTNGEPDIVVYPDSGKLGAFERLPAGGELRAMFRMTDKVDYHEGEHPPAAR